LLKENADPGARIVDPMAPVRVSRVASRGWQKIDAWNNMSASHVLERAFAIDLVMAKKAVENQEVARRRPIQARSLFKVELILEAATRLIEQGSIESMTTNAVAQTAGVSIGTLYQYFDDKDAVLDALIEREMALMSSRVLDALATPPKAPGDRVRAVISCALDAYGGRTRAHRALMSYALTRGSRNRLAPLFKQLLGQFTSPEGLAAPGLATRRLSKADAFVLMHSIGGVLRAFIASAEDLPPRAELEEALTRLILRWMVPDDASKRTRGSSAAAKA
jgi:AcrR family transcriptional regulator